MQFSDRIIFVSEAKVNTFAKIEGDEHLHLTKVLRVKPDQDIRVADGRGRFFKATVSDIKPRFSQLHIKEIDYESATPPRLHLAVALLKGKNLEQVIESCGQLPIASLTPLITDRTQGANQRESEHLLERMQMKSTVCLKQAIKPWLTQIHPPISLDTYLENISHPIAFMEPSLASAKVNWQEIEELSLLCGPEGGWSPEEITRLKLKGHSFHLGETVLRAQSAPFFACGKLSVLAPQLFKG